MLNAIIDTLRPISLAIVSRIGRATCALIVACATAASVHAQTASGEAQALKVGVLPNVSVRVILTNYKPLREYLARELKSAVEIVSAPDFAAYHARTQQGDYDIAVTAANLGRLAQLDHGHRPIAIFEPGIPALAIVLKSNPPASLHDLRGKTLALSNPQSLVALRGFAWLAEQGLQRDAHYRTVHVRNDDSLGRVLDSGEAPLAIMSAGEFRAIAPSMRDKLEVWNEFARVPGFLVIAKPTMPPAQQSRIQALLHAFIASDEGKDYGGLTGVRAIRAVADDELKSIDPFIAETRAGLRAVK